MPLLSEEEYRRYGHEIIPGHLHLASHYEAGDPTFLERHGISHVLNVAQECEPADETRRLCKVLHIPLQDSARTNLATHYDAAFAFIGSAKKSRGRALVHCFEGRNRSAAFVIAYRMKSEGLTLAEALLEVKSARALVDPNLGFRKQLRDLERSLFGEVPPSLPMTADECRLLLDIELISPADLGLYTDLPQLHYEGRLLEVRPPAPKAAPSGRGSPRGSAAGGGRRASSPARGGPSAASGAPGPAAASAGARAKAKASAAGNSALLGSRSPGRRGASSIATAAPAGRSGGAASRSPSRSRGRAPTTGPRPPEPAPRASGPVAEALGLLFDALDVEGQSNLGPEELQEARRLLGALVPAPEEPAAAAELAAGGAAAEADAESIVDVFRSFDKNGDGLLSRSELSSVFEGIAPGCFDSADIDAMLCAADADRDGHIRYDEFIRWVMTGGDAGATLLRSSAGPAAFERWALALLAARPGGRPGKQGATEEEAALAHDIEVIARGVRPPFEMTCGLDVERSQLCEVLPRQLFLTSWRGAYDREAVKAKGVTHVASVGSEFEDEKPLEDLGITYLCIVIEDDEEQAGLMQEVLARGVDFLDAAIAGGGVVLVHCAAGISRSTTVVLAYLVARRGMTLRKAFEHTRKARSMIWPNTGFMRVLTQWEEQHRGQATIRLSQYKLWSEYDSDEYAAAKVVDRDEPLAGTEE